MYVKERFVLEPETVSLLKQLEPEFGYGEFGEFMFYRSYSRQKKDGGQEDWADCVTRVINGTMSIRRDWYLKNRIAWSEDFWQEYAYGMAVSMFEMRWMPPGRGLWAMGTDFIYERGSMALYNCAYTDLTDNLGEDIEWLMDSLMNGVGVGFSPIRNDSMQLYQPRGSYTHVIEDTREAWCHSVRALIEAYTTPDRMYPYFDYSKVRGPGLPIKGFGGISSGPEPLEKLHKRIRTFCERYLSDPKYDSVTFKTDLANVVGCCVVAGNVRRSAEIAIAPIDDHTFMDLKNYNLYPYRAEHGWMSNNSVVLEKDADFDKLGMIADRVKLNGEPGFLNVRNFPFGRLGRQETVPYDKAKRLNPCITGDTKVAVADGRGYVAIKDLIDKDVPVYCVDEHDNIVIRQMRNPRVTGLNQKILKVTFDSGDSVRVTENHKFMLRDGSFKEAKNLQFNDSLAVMHRYTPEACEGESYWDKYISIGYRANTVAEHVTIARHLLGLLDTDHVHHKDENRLNNHPDNLEPKHSTDHLSEHSVGMENANCSGYTNEQLIEIGVNLCKRLGRKFSHKEWQQYGPIKSFSGFRKNELGSIVEFAFTCAKRAGVLNEELDPRTLRKYVELEEQGYEVKVIGSKVHIKKKCEVCNEPFWVDQARREQGACSAACGALLVAKLKSTSASREAATEKKQDLFTKQLDVYTGLRATLGRKPIKDEFKDACELKDLSSWVSWKKLELHAIGHNHRVVSVEEDGYEDVYNGTVDDYHNFFVGGWVRYTEKGRKVETGICNTQCGEITLEHREVCNVAETCPTRCYDEKQWYKACEYATFYTSTVSLLPTHQPTTNAVVARNRRIGVSIIDFTGWKHERGLHKVIKYLREGYKVVTDTNKRFAAEAGVPESIRKTTIKPGGTVPKVVGRTPGAGYPTFDYTLRRVRIQRNSPIWAVLVMANVPYEQDFYSDNTDVFEFPIIQGPAKPAEQVSLWEQAMNLVILQREWSDNAVSNTLYFKPKWQLVEHIDRDHVQALNMYTQYAASLILGDEQEWSTGDLKIKFNRHVSPLEIDVYELNPNHEEDDIEAVLASIAPSVKSVSLLPHTAGGVYKQMPEEGITKEEYNRRVSEIRPIDWSVYQGGDGIDEKYCDAGHCIAKGAE